MKNVVFILTLLAVGLGASGLMNAHGTRLALSAGHAPPRQRLLEDKIIPIWSKDGKLISYCYVHAPGKFRVHLIKPDGTQDRDFFGRDGTVSYISSTGQVLFSWLDQSGVNDYEIYSMNLDGSGLKQLTDNPAVEVFASWSSDLSRIAFVSNRDGLPELYVMNADGSGQVNLSKTPKATEGARPPSWSPDDRWLLFHSDMDGDDEIYKIHLDGTGLQKLTDNGVGDLNPAFSPDGKSIAFTSNRKGTKDELDNRIFLMNADGTNQRQVGDISPRHGPLSWSPKGDQLTFHAYDGYTSEIFTIHTDGTRLRQLTFSPSQPLLETLKSKGVNEAQKLFAEHKQKGSVAGLFSFSSMIRLGNEYFGKKEYDRAIAAFTFLTETYPDEANFWNSLGKMYKEGGDKEKAIRCLKQSLTLSPAPAVRDSSLAMLRELGVSD